MIITLFSIVQNTLFSAGTHVKSQGCVLEAGCVVGAGWRTGKKGEGDGRRLSADGGVGLRAVTIAANFSPVEGILLPSGVFSALPFCA
ncbi:MAG: hypothetical protein HQL78_09020 [Magnetococcales bacterium]|nr:hypothetical protein [Magnetococcales bacterium]